MESRISRGRMAAIAAGAWIVLTLAFAIPDYFVARALHQPVSWHRALLGVAPHFIIWALFALAIASLARRWPIARGRVAPRAALHFLFALAFYGTDCAISFALMPALLHDPRLTPEMMRALSIRSFYNDFVLYWLIVGVVHLLDESRRRAALEREFSIAQLSALRSQIQPHFLFNTLNAIAELLHADARAAERMTTSLADLLRGTLDLGDRQEIPLRDELQLLDLYLGIQQTRFSDSIAIERHVEPNVLSALVPPLLLQPLVENAFRHGLARKRQHGRLDVLGRRSGGQLVLEVIDNGAGFTEPVHEGIGLRNTRVRLEQMHGEAQSMKLASGEGGGAHITISMPLREAVR